MSRWRRARSTGSSPSAACGSPPGSRRARRDRGGAGTAPSRRSRPPGPPPAPMVPTATVHLVSVADGTAMGEVTFEEHGADVTMAGTFNNLPPGPHAFYIHQVGDCSAKGKKIGKHLDPTKAKHGPPA